MKMNKLYAILIAVLILGCSEDKEDPPTPPEVKNPVKATLLYPENNSDCFTGNVVSENETEVLFQWEAGENTNSYVLELKELESGETRTINTVTTSQSIRIKRAMAYSWSVTSKGASGSLSARSETWRFYNVGEPQSSYPPFPAEVIAPSSGSSVQEGLVKLEWEASDIDNDIQNYKVLCDTANPPAEVKGQTSSKSLQINVTSGNVYYWQIITKDKQGNSSNSQVFQFNVN